MFLLDSTGTRTSHATSLFWRAASISVLVVVFLLGRGTPVAMQVPVLYVLAVVPAMMAGSAAWVWVVAALASALVLLHGLDTSMPVSLQAYQSESVGRLGVCGRIGDAVFQRAARKVCCVGMCLDSEAKLGVG